MTDYTHEQQQLAKDVLNSEEIREKNEKNLSAAGYLEGKFGIDIAEFDSRYALRDALEAAKHDLPPEQQRVAANEQQTSAGTQVSDMSETDQRARSVMIPDDLAAVSRADTSPAAWLRDEFDLRVSDFSSDDELRDALNSRRAESKRNWNQ